MLLQGILSLQDAFGPSPLSVAQLRTIVRDTHFTRTLSSRLPALESQLADTCGILDDFAEEIQNQYSWQVCVSGLALQLHCQAPTAALPLPPNFC